MKRLLICFLVLTQAWVAKAQYTRYTIQLTDKNGTPFTLGNPAPYLSPRALLRRTKQHLIVDSTDLPINPVYLDSIGSIPGVTLVNHSKWLNQVLVKISDPAALAHIAHFSFVQSATPVANAKANRYGGSPFLNEETISPLNRVGRNGITGRQGDPAADTNHFTYGNNYAQIHIHEGEFLHNNGFHGEGMVIAVLDAGFFHYLDNPAFDSLRQNNQVLGTYDFVNGKESVNEENTHGAFCFSIMAANVPGQMVGSAPKAAYWLLKTEDTQSEYPIEEQNWAAAAEFADSAGADLISSSLGYGYFDDPALNQVYSVRNGHSTPITRAANAAVAKGMIVTASVGNSGTASDESHYVLCPADGDSVLAVGAVDTSGRLASFSSWGPNAAGALKPNVVSVGLSTVFASYDGTITTGSGTSFSNPNLAGLIACLWQAFPNNNVHDIIDAVQKSADRYASPDERFGYGIPDFKKAFAILQQQNNTVSYPALPADQWIRAYPVPYRTDFTLLLKARNDGNILLELTDAAGRTIERQTIAVYTGGYYTVHFEHAPALAGGVYFIVEHDGTSRSVVRVVRQ